MSGKVLHRYQKGREKSGVLPGGPGRFRRTSQRVVSGWEVHPNGREGFEAFPNGRGGIESYPKGPRRIGSPTLRARKGWEALSQGREGSGGPSRGSGSVGTLEGTPDPPGPHQWLPDNPGPAVRILDPSQPSWRACQSWPSLVNPDFSQPIPTFRKSFLTPPSPFGRASSPLLALLRVSQPLSAIREGLSTLSRRPPNPSWPPLGDSRLLSTLWEGLLTHPNTLGQTLDPCQPSQRSSRLFTVLQEDLSILPVLLG